MQIHGQRHLNKNITKHIHVVHVSTEVNVIRYALTIK